MSDQSSSGYTRHIRKDDDPFFTAGMAAAFFDLTPQSFLMKERLGYWQNFDGTPLVVSRTKGGDRRFSLNDLQAIAHSLRRQNKMTSRQMKLIILRIDAFKEPIKKHRNRYRKGTIGGVKQPPPDVL
jgi:hypothetical protein